MKLPIAPKFWALVFGLAILAASAATLPAAVLVTWTSYGNLNGGFANPGNLTIADGIWYNEVSRIDASAPASPTEVTGIDYTNSNSVLNASAFSAGVYTADTNRMTFRPQNFGAIILDRWISFTVAPSSGYQLTLTELDWNIFNVNSTQNMSYAVRSSIDSFATDLQTGTLTANGHNPGLTDLTGGSFDNLSSAVEFRFYLWDSAGSNLSFFLDNGSIPADLSMQISGTAIPEPSSIALGGIAVLALGLAGFRRQHRRV